MTSVPLVAAPLLYPVAVPPLHPQVAAPRPRRVGRSVGMAAAGVLVSLSLGSFTLTTLGVGLSGFLDEYALALLIGLVASLVPVAVLRFLGRRNPAPWWLYAAAFGWGGLVAAETAGWVNTAVDSLVLAPISDTVLALARPPLAGPVEEPLKALGVVLAFAVCARHVHSSRDGFVIGALIGLGFNWAETADYVLIGAADTGVAPWAAQFGGRFALFALGSHALWTGLFGLFLGLTRQPGRRVWLRFAPFVGLLIVVVAHASYNGLFVLLGVLSAGEPTAADAAVPVANTFAEFLLSFGVVSAVELAFVPVWGLAVVMLYRSGRSQRTAGTAPAVVQPGWAPVGHPGAVPPVPPAAAWPPHGAPWPAHAPAPVPPAALPWHAPTTMPAPAARRATVPVPVPVPVPLSRPVSLPGPAPATRPTGPVAPAVRAQRGAPATGPVAPTPRGAAAARLTSPDIALPQLLLPPEPAPLASTPS